MYLVGPQPQRPSRPLCVHSAAHSSLQDCKTCVRAMESPGLRGFQRVSHPLSGPHGLPAIPPSTVHHPPAPPGAITAKLQHLQPAASRGILPPDFDASSSDPSWLATGGAEPKTLKRGRRRADWPRQSGRRRACLPTSGSALFTIASITVEGGLCNCLVQGSYYIASMHFSAVASQPLRCWYPYRAAECRSSHGAVARESTAARRQLSVQCELSLTINRKMLPRPPPGRLTP